MAGATAADVVDGPRPTGVGGGIATVVGAFFAPLTRKDAPAADESEAAERPITAD
ncbi:hypothetical protein [Kitasatospora sp. SUK 42]|uniref:hypothetical protein n=1 Tax=Kitasatospora sp. SUK 42 TaxID=1588882 RepID=UPI001C31C880|nr:hypothetical protein [Kitasatospora sp. SUK 42]MBV2156550.1 hypothetical protein [Kitasatospora sp. SUK 42]